MTALDFSYSVARCKQFEDNTIRGVFHSFGYVFMHRIRFEFGYLVDLDLILGEGTSFIEAKGADVGWFSSFLGLSSEDSSVFEPNQRVGVGEVEENGEGRGESPRHYIQKSKAYKGVNYVPDHQIQSREVEDRTRSQIYY